MRVLLVDDHRMFTDMLRSELEREGATVMVAATAAAARDQLRQIAPDVMLVDYRLPDGDGLELVRWARARVPRVRPVLVTQVLEDWLVQQGLEAGCVGFVGKDRSLDDLLRAVNAVARDELAVAPEVLARVLPRIAGTSTSQTFDLTVREREVLDLCAAGRSTAEMARELGLSRTTLYERLKRHGLGKR
ncbi:MAG: response regulator transcription factor [Acidimicrobiales bacterium]|nr:response regulator transcription factor [Acidimicrobiales bacterium]